MTFREKTLWVAVAVGVLFGLLTSQVGSLSMISANPFVGIVQMVLICTILPGAITMAITGFTVIGVVVNVIFYFLLCLMIGALIGRVRRKGQR
jgi:hypothetical protein